MKSTLHKKNRQSFFTSIQWYQNESGISSAVPEKIDRLLQIVSRTCLDKGISNQLSQHIGRKKNAKAGARERRDYMRHQGRSSAHRLKILYPSYDSIIYSSPCLLVLAVCLIFYSSRVSIPPSVDSDSFYVTVFGGRSSVTVRLFTVILANSRGTFSQ
jgi:hypothetical protein